MGRLPHLVWTPLDELLAQQAADIQDTQHIILSLPKDAPRNTYPCHKRAP